MTPNNGREQQEEREGGRGIWAWASLGKGLAEAAGRSVHRDPEDRELRTAHGE